MDTAQSKTVISNDVSLDKTFNGMPLPLSGNTEADDSAHKVINGRICKDKSKVKVQPEQCPFKYAVQR